MRSYHKPHTPPTPSSSDGVQPTSTDTTVPVSRPGFGHFIKTPLGNTGFNRKNLDTGSFIPSESSSCLSASQDSSPRFCTRIHWLQFTFNFNDQWDIELLAQKLSKWLNDEFSLDGGPISRGTKFLSSGHSVLGIKLAWNLPTLHNPGFGWISIPGSVLDTTDYSFILLLFDLTLIPDNDPKFIYNCKYTRLDLAIDDYSKSVTTDLIYQTALDSNFSGFRHAPVQDKQGNWKPPSYKLVSSPAIALDGQLHQAKTINFGSRQSDKEFYVYDKWLESDGEIDSIRFEARYKDEQAHHRCINLLQALQKSELHFYKLIGSLVTATIDFIDRSQSDRLSGCLRFEWWGQFIDELGRLKLPIPKKKKTIQDTVDWMFRQWRSTLAIIECTSGFEDIMNAIIKLSASGKDNLKASHNALIRQIKKENFNVCDYLELVYN